MNATRILTAETEGVITLGAADVFRADAIVSRTLVKTPELRVVQFHFDAGQELTEHTSPHRALVQILTGACEFKLGATWRALVAGDLVHMPPLLPHAVRATVPMSFLLTLCPSPQNPPPAQPVPSRPENQTRS